MTINPPQPPFSKGELSAVLDWLWHNDSPLKKEIGGGYGFWCCTTIPPLKKEIGGGYGFWCCTTIPPLKKEIGDGYGFWCCTTIPPLKKGAEGDLSAFLQPPLHPH